MARDISIKKYVELFFASARVGGLTFGGGYAMLPILQREMVEKKHWSTEAEILDYYALAQCLPGIIMVNTMAFIGHRKFGKPGAIAAAIGAIAPSLLIILLIAMLLTGFADYPVVQNAFAGIRVCVCVLIFNSILKLWKSSVIDLPCLILFVAVAIGSLLTNLSPIIFVVLAAVIGIILSGMKKSPENIGGHQ